MPSVNVHDVIEQRDALIARQYKFILSTDQWAAYVDDTIKDWRLERLQKSRKTKIPVSSGIYTLLIQPDIARHPACSYLMYVGQAVNLRKRFGEYLNKERKASGRPKVFTFLNIYTDYVWFAFARVSEASLTTAEDALVEAHLPPCNDRVPATISKARNAF